MHQLVPALVSQMVGQNYSYVRIHACVVQTSVHESFRSLSRQLDIPPLPGEDREKRWPTFITRSRNPRTGARDKAGLFGSNLSSDEYSFAHALVHRG